MSEKINKISLSSNDDKRLQSTDSVETYGYRTSKSLSRIKEKNKCKNNKNNTKMINFDHITKESIKERNPNWPKTSDHPYIILRIRSSGSPSRTILDKRRIIEQAKFTYSPSGKTFENK